MVGREVSIPNRVQNPLSGHFERLSDRRNKGRRSTHIGEWNGGSGGTQTHLVEFPGLGKV